MSMEAKNVVRLMIAMASTGLIKHHGKVLEVFNHTSLTHPLYRTGRRTWAAFDSESPGVKMAMIEFLAERRSARFGVGYTYIDGKTLSSSFISFVDEMVSNGEITLCKIV